MPRDGGSIDPEAALVFANSACFVPDGADPDDPIVMIGVQDLSVDVDGEPAALVPFADFESGWLWRIDPPPAAGSIVTITGCDQAERAEDLCYPVAIETDEKGPLLRWSFTVDGEPKVSTLVEPVIADLRRTGTTDPYSGEEWNLWSFTVERGEDDPGTPMLVDITMSPGGGATQLPWTEAEQTSEELVLAAPKGADVCIEARTVDAYGTEGPTATVCSREGCGCTTGGSGPGALALGVLVLGLRRRHR